MFRSPRFDSVSIKMRFLYASLAPSFHTGESNDVRSHSIMSAGLVRGFRKADITFASWYLSPGGVDRSRRNSSGGASGLLAIVAVIRGSLS